MKIFNATNRYPTEYELSEGVSYMSEEIRSLYTIPPGLYFELERLGTVSDEIIRRATRIVEIAAASKPDRVLVDGPPYFIAEVAGQLLLAGKRPVYAYRTRNRVTGESQVIGTIQHM